MLRAASFFSGHILALILMGTAYDLLPSSVAPPGSIVINISDIGR